MLKAELFKSEPKEKVTLRLSPELKRKVDESARQLGTSVNKFIERLLQYYFRDLEKELGKLAKTKQ